MARMAAFIVLLIPILITAGGIKAHARFSFRDIIQSISLHLASIYGRFPHVWCRSCIFRRFSSAP